MNAKPTSDPIQVLLNERRSLSFPLAWLQRQMTALPDVGEVAPKTGPIRRFVRDVALLGAFALSAGVMGSVAQTGGAAVIAIAPGFLFALAAAGRLRKLTVGHMHELLHGVGFEGWRNMGLPRGHIRALRFTLAETCSVIALTTPARVYMRNHGRHHGMRWLGTIFEPDGAELAYEGFIKGLPLDKFYPQLASKLFNPLWYLRLLTTRFKRTMGAKGGTRRVAVGAMWLGLSASAAILPIPVWILAIGLPWFVLYPAASLLQLITEHPYGDHIGATSLETYAARTWDRIPWEPTPQGSGWVAWSKWALKLLTYHFPARLAVLDTTMIWHRYHHIAWLIQRPFDDWWAINHEALKAWVEGAFPERWEGNTLKGIPEALERQRQHLAERDI